jgi:hypothetical protein
LSVTTIKNDKPKQRFPIWGFMSGVALIAIGGGLLYIAVIGIKSGQTIKFTRSHPGDVTRRADPAEFWKSEGVFIINGALCVAAGICQFKNMYRLRKWRQFIQQQQMPPDE